MDIATFEKFLQERFKVDNKLGTCSFACLRGKETAWLCVSAFFDYSALIGPAWGIAGKLGADTVVITKDKTKVHVKSNIPASKRRVGRSQIILTAHHTSRYALTPSFTCKWVQPSLRLDGRRRKFPRFSDEFCRKTGTSSTSRRSTLRSTTFVTGCA